MKNKKIILIITVVILLIIGALILFFSKSREENQAIERTELQLAHLELLIEDIELGQGKGVQSGETVTVHYLGRLEDGTIFDSSYDKGRTFTFIVGKGRVIPGWEIGIEGMRPGGKRRLTIPPELAYGQSGVRGMIPSNATIIFEIELILIDDTQS